MVAAFRRAGSFRGDAAVTTWLHRIVVNASLDRLRRRKVRAADALPDDLDDHAGRGSTITSATDADDPVAASERAEVQQQVLTALGHAARRAARRPRPGRHGGLLGGGHGRASSASPSAP